MFAPSLLFIYFSPKDDGIREYFTGPPGPPGPPGSISDDDLANRVINYLQSKFEITSGRIRSLLGSVRKAVITSSLIYLIKMLQAKPALYN